MSPVGEVGRSGSIPELLLPWAIKAFAVLTHLGDWVVLLALATLAYLIYDRRTGGFVGGALFIAFAVTIALKAWFALPRPPATLQYVPESGYTFPSGHALGATVGWGALALTLERISTAPRRVAVASLVVIAVALSRVVIGVHYPEDVIAGVAIGLVILGGARRWGREEPRNLFGVGAAAGLIAAIVAGGSAVAYALLGGGIGAVAVWPLVVSSDGRRDRQRAALVAVVGGLLAGALVVVSAAAVLAFSMGAFATITVLLAPVVSEHWLDGDIRERTRG